jgi:NH3-dependent NAD+ synthetase
MIWRRDTKQWINEKHTEPKIGAELPSFQEQVDKSQVHEDISNENNQDVSRVSTLYRHAMDRQSNAVMATIER